jgi:hypothetical protein
VEIDGVARSLALSCIDLPELDRFVVGELSKTLLQTVGRVTIQVI